MRISLVTLLVFVTAFIASLATLMVPCDCPALPQNINGSVLFEDDDSYYYEPPLDRSYDPLDHPGNGDELEWHISPESGLGRRPSADII